MGCSHASSVATPPPLYASPPWRRKSSREDRIATLVKQGHYTSTLLTHNAIKPELKKPEAAIKGLDVPPGASESIWNVQPDALDVQPDDLETRAQALNKSVVLQRTSLHTAMERQLNGYVSCADMEYQLSISDRISAVTLDAAVAMDIQLCCERRSAPRVLFNNSPFHIAAYTNDSAALKRQIDGKAAVNAVSPDTINSSKTSALHIAASQGALECIQVLVAAGANINVRNGVKATPLMLAVESGHDKCARALVAAQCEVNAKDAREQTALHWAARMSRDDSVKMLIDAKADVNSKCCAGYTPCAMAEDWGTHATWKLIEAAGGSRFP